MIRVDRSRCRWKADTFWSVWFPGASAAVANTCLVYTPIFRNSYPGSIKLWAKRRRDISVPSKIVGCFAQKKRRGRGTCENDAHSYQSLNSFFKNFCDRILDYSWTTGTLSKVPRNMMFVTVLYKVYFQSW